MNSRLRSVIRLALLTVPLSASSCYAPEISDCDYRCSKSGLCPDGFTCNSDWFCVQDANTECPIGRGDAGGSSPGGSTAGRSAEDSGAGGAEAGQGGEPAGGGDASPGARGGAGGDEGGAGQQGGGAGGERCPAPSPPELPPPCLGSPYSQRLSASGGEEPYSFQILGLSGGLSFDGVDFVISGTPVDRDPLIVRVVDAAGCEATTTVVPRLACWLAYVSTEDATSSLHLYDSALETRLEPVALAEGQGIVDFAFSPDGRVLAYRLRESDGRHRLGLLDLGDFGTRVIDFEGPDSGEPGSVTQYSWSPDSTTLAVAFETATEGTFLAGVRFSGTPAAGVPAVSASIDSSLVWSGQLLGFSGLESEEFPFYFAMLEGPGFSAPAFVAWNPELPEIRPAPDGFWVVSWEDTDFWSLEHPQEPHLVHHDSDIISPSGLYTARSFNGVLDVFPYDTTDTKASASNCSMLVSWAAGRERLACLHDMDELYVFDVDTSGFEVQGKRAVRAESYTDYELTQDTGQDHRRTFSPTGRWLALTTRKWLYLLDATASPPVVVMRPSIAPSSDAVELSFSPDERWLLEHRGQWVLSHDLSRIGPRDSFVLLNNPADDPMSLPAPCEEEFAVAPSAWCGDARGSSTMPWSPDSRFAAFATAAGGLWVVLAGRPHGETQAVEDCDPGCIAQFGFQPE